MFTERNELLAGWLEENHGAPDLLGVDEPLRKTHEYVYRFASCEGRASSCHLRIYQGRGRPPVIVCTAPRAGAAPGRWAVECLAAEVVRRHFPQAIEALGEPFIWLEQRAAPAGYAWVTFDSYAPRCVQHAHGVQHVALRQAHRLSVDRSAVEELIGHALTTDTHLTGHRGWRNHRSRRAPSEKGSEGW